MEKEEYYRMFTLENNHWWYVGLHELVKLHIQNKGVDFSILDAGCGTGRMLELLDEYTYEGIDYSSDAIDLCFKRGLKNVKVENLNVWQAPADKYSCIISLDVLYHAEIKDEHMVMKKFYQALKPDGILVVNLAAFNCLRRAHDRVVQAERRYIKKTLTKNLREIGFKIDTATYRLPFLFFVILIKKIIEFFIPKKIGSDLKNVSPWLNKLLLCIVRLENKMIVHGVFFPFGSSIFVVCRK